MRLLPQRNPVAEELCSLELLVLLVCCFFFFPKRDLFHGNDRVTQGSFYLQSLG